MQDNGAAPVEPDWDKLPIEERLAAKSWKGRLSAYTALIHLFKHSDESAARTYINNPSLVKEWVRDSNAVSQEKGVEAAAAFIDCGGKQAATKTRSEVVPSVLEKCLGSARAGTRTKAIELCLLYVECEEDQAEGVIGDVSPGLDVKQPKVVAGSVTVLKEIVRLFGPKTISVKPVLRLLPKIFAHADKTVRAEGTGLALALHAYLGPALDPHLAELKQVQVKELGEAFEKADQGEEGFGKLKQSRFTRSQQRERDVKEAEATLEGPAAGAAGDDGVDQVKEDAPPDVFDLAEPVNALAKIPPDLDTNLSSSAWKVRKETLESVLPLVKVPRLQSGNYTELVSALAGRMTDANVVCLMLAANCLEAIALGLRKEFSGYKSAVVAPILARTKEKKQNVLDALGAALDAIFATIDIREITEEVVNSSKDKNPSVKAETMKWYTRCLSTTTTPPPKSDIDPLFDAFKLALQDSNEPVRVAAADVIGTLMKVVGERTLGMKVEELDDLRKQKVKDAFGKAVVKCKNGASAQSRAAAPTAAAPPAAKPKPKPPVANKENAAPPPPAERPPSPPRPAVARGPPARLLAKKPAAASAPAPAAAATAPPEPKAAPAAASAPAKAGPSKPSEPLKYKMSQEDAESQVENGALPAAIIAQLSDANWKIRLEGITALHDVLDGGELANVDSELVVRSLSKKPGWKESNFQVGVKMFGIFQLLAERSPSFGKSSAALSVPALSDKLGDMKLKKSAGDAMSTFAEKTSLQFVLSLAYEPMSKQKAPKAQADAILWVDQAIKDFGIVGLSIRDLIEYLKVGLKSSNAAVRTNATKTLVTLRLYVGADIVSFLQDLNPQLLTTIESEFAKVSGESPPEPTRVGADTVVAAAPSGGGAGKGKGAAGGDDPMDELFPRVELDKLISSANIAACGDANWKIRKEALESIQSILEANKRLKPSNLTDLTTPLKQRLADSNKIVQQLALDIVSRIAAGMGKPFDKHARTFAGPAAQVLSESKAPIRAAAIATLTAMADAAGLDSMISSFEKPLDSANPLLRKELLAWLETRLADEDAVATVDLASIAGSVLGCLEDRTAEVRKSATAILPAIVSRAGFSTVMDLTSKLKPASRSTVVPLIEAARSAAPSATTAPATSRAAAPSAASASSSAAPVKAAASRPLAPSRPATGVSKTLRTVASSASLPPLDDAPRVAAPPPRKPPATVSKVASSARASPVPSNSSAHGGKEPPFANTDPKPKTIRAAKETGSLRWVVEGTPRQDQVEALLQQMTPNTSADLLAQLFSKDHNAERDYVAALTILDDCAKGEGPSSAAAYDLSPDEMRTRLVVNVDVIFKYITLRIGLTSTSITVKCLDLIDHLIPVLDAEGYKLSDYETSALLISLVAKVGDPKETIRNRVRAIFKDICRVYPFSKVFLSILEHGINSKNARIRAESAEELGRLFTQHGPNAFPVAKALPLIAKLISDRDATVRTAALHAVGAVYSHLGAEQTWKLVGAMPDKEKSMLEERLKRTAGGSGTSSSAPSAAASPARSSTPVGRIGTPSRLSAGERNGGAASPANGSSRGIPAPRAGTGVSRLARPQTALPAHLAPASEMDAPSPRKAAPSSLQQPRQLARPSSSASSSRIPSNPSIGSSRTAVDDYDLMSADQTDNVALIESIDTQDLAKCADSLKQLQVVIASSPESLVPHADFLVETITAKMGLGFSDLNRQTAQVQLRLCKHLMQTLSSFFDHRTLGQAVTTPVLTDLLAELTGRLLDTAENPASEAISSLSKVLNMVLIRIFHHADANACFSALFSVLHDATHDLRELHGQELTDRAKYAELVMKCLWKVSKTVKESLESRSLAASRLLRDINDFLERIPPAQWRRRASDNIPLADMPLRTVKTILQQVVSVFGDQVFDELDEIDSAENSFVYQYLLRLGNTSSSAAARRGSANSHASSVPLSKQSSSGSTSSARREPSLSTTSPTLGGSAVDQPHSSGSSTAAVASPGSGDIEMNHALKQIFDLIGDPTHSRQGIAALYEYQKLHPEANGRITTWMSGTGNYFQSYLTRALANLAAADEEASAPTSRPAASAATPTQPTSTTSSSSRASARMSYGGVNAPPTPQGDRLTQLQGMFGFNGPSA